MKRKIMWSSQHLEINTLNGNLQEESSGIINDFEEEHKAEIHNVLSTPFGFWRVDDAMNPYKQFKLWMGHTNFTINIKVAEIIKNTPGIEVLSILTRYRFLIGVGEMFDISDVRVAIEKSLGCNREEIDLILDTNLRKEVEKLKNKLAKSTKFNKWAVMVMPNGSIDYVTNERGNKQFIEKVLLYRNAVDHSSGILIESDEE